MKSSRSSATEITPDLLECILDSLPTLTKMIGVVRFSHLVACVPRSKFSSILELLNYNRFPGGRIAMSNSEVEMGGSKSERFR